MIIALLTGIAITPCSAVALPESSTRDMDYYLDSFHFSSSNESRSPIMAHLADALKEEGNQLFRSGDFEAAEAKYTGAITRYANNPLIFTNRAFARLKLQRWEGVVDDCLKSIELTGGHGFNYKAWYYLGESIPRPPSLSRPLPLSPQPSVTQESHAIPATKQI